MGFWASLGIAVTSGIGAYFASYLSEKGKNLATREDIAALTKVVEDIKTENALLVERFKSQQQLRYAALDKRLEAHQQAFERWRNLSFCVYRQNPEQIEAEANECIGWWAAHCLYLEPEARVAFTDAIRDAMAIQVFLKSPAYDDSSLGLVGRVLELTKAVSEVGNTIMKAVTLPLLTEVEEKIVSKPDSLG